MSDPFGAFGRLAASSEPNTVKAGRYAFQAAEEAQIVADIKDKLLLTPTVRLFEIGCGPGNLLIPLSFLVAACVGMDHPDVIAAAKARFHDDRVRFVGGQFPDDMPEGRFDRVLAYSVVQYLKDFDATIGFVDAALSLLDEGGRLLIGDIPNADKKRRFLESERGKIADAEWQNRMRSAGGDGAKTSASYFEGTESVGAFSDHMMAELIVRYRRRGLHVYLLPQPAGLPFGETREDFLIVRP